jgi:superoxide dismutase, Fe-Mn family
MQYSLPDLPYDYGALEPHVSGKLLELHHDKHHKTYVDGANRALEQLAAARDRGDFAQIAALEHALAFNVSGHALHSLFWQNLSPDGGGKPEGALHDAIASDFGGFDSFRKQMSQCAATVMGSGWAALVWEPLAGRLLTAQLHDHQSNTLQGSTLLLVFDAWEHAYYLQYHNEKAKFFEALWNVVDWRDVAARFDEVSQRELDRDALKARGVARPTETKRAPAGRSGGHA